MGGKAWTKSEDRALTKSYPFAEEFMRKTGRSKKSVYNRAFILGLTAKQGTEAHRRRLRVRSKSRPNRGSFKRGNVPWNKGTRGVMKPSSTSFKKGGLRGNAARKYRAVGAISFNHKDGCYMIKYRDVPGKKCWKTYAIWLWEQHHGPIPKRMIVVHKDGNSTNDELNNLCLMTRAEHIKWLTRAGKIHNEKHHESTSKAAKERWEVYRRIKEVMREKRRQDIERKLSA